MTKTRLATESPEKEQMSSPFVGGMRSRKRIRLAREETDSSSVDSHLYGNLISGFHMNESRMSHVKSNI